MSVMLYPCMFCVILSMDLFVLGFAYLTVFVKTIRNMFVCGCYFVDEGYEVA